MRIAGLDLLGNLLAILGLLLVVGSSLLIVCSLASTVATPVKLPGVEELTRPGQITASDGQLLSVSYQNPWNVEPPIRLSEVPRELLNFVLQAEDRRFFSHRGADWLARGQAIVSNWQEGRIVRGASTISEQVAKMLNPRPRSFWARWLEGLEARELEDRFGKTRLLEWYLHQVPYGRNRRGLVQAARLYFDRSLETCSLREWLALAVLIRAPSALDPWRSRQKLEKSIDRFAYGLFERDLLSEAQYREVKDGHLLLAQLPEPLSARHFVRYVKKEAEKNRATSRQGVLHSTLNASLHSQTQALLDGRLRQLNGQGVSRGASLVIDHRSGEVLAWVNSSQGISSRGVGEELDAVLARRQAGSTLKPFVYSLLIEQGSTSATKIEDRPLFLPVGLGMHEIRNYGRIHYGQLTLREALGNSLNTPVVRALQAVGVNKFYWYLSELGFSGLREVSESYGEGLALGVGEVSLFELVRAYSAFARGGTLAPMKVLKLQKTNHSSQQEKVVIESRVTSIVGDILSDPDARRKEFGESGVLDFDSRVAVKTGTSSDYRDAWAIGYNGRFTAGVWLGNLDRTRMDEISGASGPALVLRGIFQHLTRVYGRDPVLDLALDAPRESEAKFEGKGTADNLSSGMLDILTPTEGALVACDPRIPDSLERLEVRLSEKRMDAEYLLLVDGNIVQPTLEKRYFIPVSHGRHLLVAKARYSDGTSVEAERRYQVRCRSGVTEG